MWLWNTENQFAKLCCQRIVHRDINAKATVPFRIHTKSGEENSEKTPYQGKERRDLGKTPKRSEQKINI